MNIVKLRKGSKAGKLAAGDYPGFVQELEEAETPADVIGDPELFFATEEQKAKDYKNAIDAAVKPIKAAHATLREFTTQYMLSMNLKKLEGKKIKSVTCSKGAPKTVTRSAKEIMVGRKYVPVSNLSKDDLVALLEKKGVKTRINSYEETIEAKPSLRINK